MSNFQFPPICVQVSIPLPHEDRVNDTVILDLSRYSSTKKVCFWKHRGSAVTAESCTACVLQAAGKVDNGWTQAAPWSYSSTLDDSAWQLWCVSQALHRQ